MSALFSLVAHFQDLPHLQKWADHHHLQHPGQTQHRVVLQAIDIDHLQPEEVDLVVVVGEKMTSMFRTVRIRDHVHQHRGDGNAPTVAQDLLHERRLGAEVPL
jgi:hypothetical protein